MTTAADIISDAALTAGIGDQYNTADANTSGLWFRTLNRMLDSWSREQLTIYDVVEGTIPLTSGVATYQVGVGQGLGVRPAIVEYVSIIDANNVTYPVQVIGVDEWAQIIYKPAPGRPQVMYSDGNFPISNFNFWPTPSFTNDVAHVFYWNVLTQFANLTSAFSMPPGFELALVTNLACLIGPPAGFPPTPELKAQARGAKSNARALNNQRHILQTDVPFNRRKAFNILTGGFT